MHLNSLSTFLVLLQQEREGSRKKVIGRDRERERHRDRDGQRESEREECGAQQSDCLPFCKTGKQPKKAQTAAGADADENGERRESVCVRVCVL